MLSIVAALPVFFKELESFCSSSKSGEGDCSKWRGGGSDERMCAVRLFMDVILTGLLMSTKVVGKIDRLVVEIVCAFAMVAALPDLLDGLESFCSSSSSSTRGKKDHSNWQGGGWQCSEG